MCVCVCVPKQRTEEHRTQGHKFLNYTCKAHFGPLPSDLACHVQVCCFTQSGCVGRCCCCEEFVKGSRFSVCAFCAETHKHARRSESLRLNLEVNFKFTSKLVNAKSGQYKIIIIFSFIIFSFSLFQSGFSQHHL